jgi:hypothetical protein
MSEQFIKRPIRMLSSPAWRVLSLSARRFIDRLEIELARHGGRDNGRLPLTYDQLVVHGMDRHAIAPAQREADALGLAVVTERGHAGNAEWRKSNHFRLTYIPTAKTPATNEWENIKTVKDAERIAKAARRPLKKRRKTARRGAPFPSGGFSHSQWGKPTLLPVGETHTTGPNSPVGKTHTTSRSDHLIYPAEPEARERDERSEAETGPDGRLLWTTPRIEEVTDPDEAALIRSQCGEGES